MFNIAPFDGDWKDSLMECGNHIADASKKVADMVICACGVARFSIVDALYLFKDCIDEASNAVITLGMLETAIKKKMEINRQRKWNFENGQYQHKEE